MDFVEEAVDIAKTVQAKSKKLADFKAVLADDGGVVAQCADLKSRWPSETQLQTNENWNVFFQGEWLCFAILDAWPWRPLSSMNLTLECF